MKENNAKGIFTDQSQIVTYIYSKDRGASDDLVHIAVHDTSLKIGNKWSPEDNFDEATDFEGRLKDFSDIIVEGRVDTIKAGTYGNLHYFRRILGKNSGRRASFSEE